MTIFMAVREMTISTGAMVQTRYMVTKIMISSWVLLAMMTFSAMMATIWLLVMPEMITSMVAMGMIYYGETGGKIRMLFFQAIVVQTTSLVAVVTIR